MKNGANVVKLSWPLKPALFFATIAIVAPLCEAQMANAAVLQLEAWRRAVTAGDSNALAAMYTPNPRIFGPKQAPSDLQSEIQYWNSWKARGLKSISTEIEQTQEPQPGFHVLMIQLTMNVVENGTNKKYYLKVGQGYIEQGTAWKIAAEKREAETRLKGPAQPKDLYPADADPRKEINEALQTATRTHKRVLLVFGGNWCYDCHVLDEAFHTPEIAPTLNRNFVVVHVNIGEYDKNLDLAKKYEVPLEKGVPAAAVLEPDGKLIFTQKNKEFEKAQSLAPEDILAFLKKWRPAAR